jgi:hypothetical protein
MIISRRGIGGSITKKQHNRFPCYDVPCSPWASKCFIVVRHISSSFIIRTDDGDKYGEHCTVREFLLFQAFGLFINGFAVDQLELSDTVSYDPTLSILSSISIHL